MRCCGAGTAAVATLTGLVGVAGIRPLDLGTLDTAAAVELLDRAGGGRSGVPASRATVATPDQTTTRTDLRESYEVLSKNDDAPGPGLGPSRRPVDGHLTADRRPSLAIGRWACGTYDPVMGYDVHLFRFQRGECVDIDAARLMD